MFFFCFSNLENDRFVPTKVCVVGGDGYVPGVISVLEFKAEMIVALELFTMRLTMG